MKPRVLALDFDGTIAVNDTMDVDVAAAIQEARDAGLLVVLVTGRPLSDLDALFSSPPRSTQSSPRMGPFCGFRSYRRPSRSAKGRISNFSLSSEAAESRISLVNVWSVPAPTLHHR